MKVLIACEFSGRVRDAFTSKGHEAWSCDLRRDITGSERHLIGDVEPLLQEPWDLVIAHPPCTYLCNSGVSRLYQSYGRHGDMLLAVMFFLKCLRSNSPMVCVENPIQHKWARQVIKEPYSQIIHPWQFGHPVTKATCLWLKGLPKLIPTRIVEPVSSKVTMARSRRTAFRSMERSLTYLRVAEAMALQWG